jgi:RNA recognition motif-containing protein
MAVPTRSVYVGNIPYTSTLESLMEAFAEYEPISAKIVENRGVAFIEVPARRAYAMVRDTDGSKLEGRLLSVSVAKPRENEPTHTQDQDHTRNNRQSGPRNFGPGNFGDQERPSDAPFQNRERFSPRGHDQARPYPQNPRFQNGPEAGGNDENGRGPRNDRPPFNSNGRQEGDRSGFDRNSGSQERSRYNGGPRRPGFQEGDRRPYGDRPAYNRDSRPNYGERPSNGRPEFNRESRPSGGPSNQGRPFGGRPFGGERPVNREGGTGGRFGEFEGGERGGFRPDRNENGSGRNFQDSRPGPKRPFNGGGQNRPPSGPKKFFKKR